MPRSGRGASGASRPPSPETTACTTEAVQPLAQAVTKYVINGLTMHLGTWENCGWIGVKNAPHFLRIHTAPTTFKWIKGHNRNEGNEGSDLLAKEGVRKN